MDKPEPTEICRVFISRKTSDREVLGGPSTIREKLRGYAANRLEFYDADLIEPGEDWRAAIRREIGRANIFLLVLTRPARNDFDWPLYEAGLFDRYDETGGRLVCLYPEGEELPDQLRNIQGVEATPEKMLKLIEKLFCDKEFTNTIEPVNLEGFTTFKKELETLTDEICDRINGVRDHKLTNVNYVNPYIQLILTPSSKRVDDSAGVDSTERTLRALFGLAPHPPGAERWTWGDIKKAVDLGAEDPDEINRQWMEQLENAIEKVKSGRQEDQQITGRFIAKDRKLWGPQIEIYRTYNSGTTIVDVTFTPQIHDAWVANAPEPVGLAANLGLASRIRHELIEPYLRRLPQWKINEAARTRGFTELKAVVDVIEHDGFFISQLTNNNFEATFAATDMEKLGRIYQDFQVEIKPLLHRALNEQNVDDMGKALELWRHNNAEFFNIGIPRYTDLLKLSDSTVQEA